MSGAARSVAAAECVRVEAEEGQEVLTVLCQVLCAPGGMVERVWRRGGARLHPRPAGVGADCVFRCRTSIEARGVCGAGAESE